MATRYPSSGKGSKWTTKELKSIPVTWKGDSISDGGSLNGIVRINKDSSISIKFYFRFRYNGKIQKLYCGTFPNSTIKEIRSTRDAAKEALQRGINPIDDKNAQRIEAKRAIKDIVNIDDIKSSNDLSVQDLFLAWTSEASGVKRSDGNIAIQRLYQKHIAPHIATYKIAELSDNHILDMLQKIKNSARNKDNPQRAFNRTVEAVYKDLKQMFTWAEKRQPWRKLMSGGNPALMITSAQVKAIMDFDYKAERSRTLNDAEIHELACILGTNTQNFAPSPDANEPPLHARGQCAVWLCLATLCRIGELLQASWEHVDFDKETWYIPAANTKTKQEHLVSLSSFALAQFQHLKAITGDFAYVFPSKDGTSHVGTNTLTKTIGDRQLRFKNRSKKIGGRIENDILVLSDGQNGAWTLHDLRRTGATMMQKLGIPPDIINLCQNHSLNWGNKVSKNYLHYDYAAEKAEAWNKWGAEIERILREGG
ncbi:MAG: tyrosine-type recombinase/integrase [Bradymonadia bacterium]|jgi:integrase